MMNIIMFCLLIMMILTLMMILISMMVKKKKNLMQKSSPFECGFNSLSNKRLPFSMHFFLIGIIFLIFDIEIIIIMPSIMMMKFSNTIFWMLTLMLIMIMIIVGLYHEWWNGMLNWTS
uniref:NADH-ubiquinone oxidoreductase chain 3 n=1 Tax=Krisna rufimarginata TaxID=1962558 RepID=A0A6C0MEH5_9HEMI|nr:NADH dehydrogenase subunit 3 [Krisna rufimarginata]QHV34365.1 NADH dehydrogenase subunit 3 [Krisna rufimarginata]